MMDILKILGSFAFGLWFYAKILDKPEVQNVIARLKQKKGADNIMNVSQGEVPLGTITGDMTRREVIDVWKKLKSTKN